MVAPLNSVQIGCVRFKAQVKLITICYFKNGGFPFAVGVFNYVADLPIGKTNLFRSYKNG